MDNRPVVNESTLVNVNLNHYAQSLFLSLAELKHAFDAKADLESTRKAAYERLAETSKIMRTILEKYPTIKSKELLLDASGLVQAVKTFNYDHFDHECHDKLIDAINKLYISFHSSISNDVMENILPMASVTETPLSHLYKASGKQSPAGIHQSPTPSFNPDLPEERVLAHDSGITESLIQAKAWSKYVKEIIVYIEKRIQLEIDYNRNVLKNGVNFKSGVANITNKTFLPLNSVYHNFLSKEIENANISVENFDLLTRNFLNPLNDYRIEFDKQLKKIKEDWSRETKQLTDSQNNVNKSRDLYLAKKQEMEKMKYILKSSENTADWVSNEKMEKKRRTSEEAAIRASDAEENFTKSVLAFNSQTAHTNKVKRDIILKIRDLLSILEIKVKEITSHYFETLRDSMTYSPSQINKCIDDTSRYETGKSYKDFANSLPLRSVHSPSNRSPSLNHYLPSTSQYIAELDSSESDTSSHRHLKMAASRKASSPNFIEINIEKKYSKSFKGIPAHQPSVASNNFSSSKRVFGVPLSSLSANGSVPDIVKQCLKQIELRGSQINGIYRVSGVKSKVESVCRNYETDPQSVSLANVSPNVIANVLKNFFRELPEPLMTFQLYPELIKVARKFSNNHTVEDGEDIVANLRKILARMPTVHYNTLKCLMHHLRLISHNCSVNNMPPSNLGIVFGPTLLKKNNDVNASAATLFDTNHQSRIIELLIIYSNEIFDMSDFDDDISGGGGGGGGSSTHSSRKSSFNRADVKPDLKKGGDVGQSSSRIFKSATCTSLLPSDQSKQHIVEARRQFFNSEFNQQSQPTGQRYKPAPSFVSNTFLDKEPLSPFSQITASSSSNSPSNFILNQNRIKRFTTTSNYHQSQPAQQQQQQPNRIYHKHNELSKSSSDLYSFKNTNMSIKSSNEDIV